MAKFLPVVLTYNTPDLAANMQDQLDDMALIVENDCQRPSYASMHLGSMAHWAAAWNQIMDYVDNNYGKERPDYVWMLNSDLKGISMKMGEGLVSIAEMSGMQTGAITPSFNSPHKLFHRRSSEGEWWPREASWLDWCCPMVKLDAFVACGGFDAMTFEDYGADLDLSIRMRQKGYKLWVSELSLVDHIGQATANRVGKQWSLQKMQAGLKQKYDQSFEYLTRGQE